MKEGLNVLSLCDGISCGYMALLKANIPVNHYFSSEIKDIAIRCSRENFPEIIQIGDVTKISYNKGVLKNTERKFYKGYRSSNIWKSMPEFKQGHESR